MMLLLVLLFLFGYKGRDAKLIEKPSIVHAAKKPAGEGVPLPKEGKKQKSKRIGPVRAAEAQAPDYAHSACLPR